MGLSLSRYRKKPTVAEQLKKIEDGLQKINNYKRSTEIKQKRTVASVILYGVGLYVLTCIIIFVWYLPDSSLVRLGLLIPLILVPFVIYWTKLLVSKYFARKMVRANEEYEDLKRKKTEIIDTVMETETFNKAKELLAKYAPEKLDKKVQELNMATQGVKSSPIPTDLRKRNIPAPNGSMSAARATTDLVQRPTPTSIVNMRVEQRQQHGATPRVINSSFGTQMTIPKPMFSGQRSFSDKLIEFIVGDGPGYRYALICKGCSGHNGMALKEEFLYTSFRCCYCKQFNPARSQRPVAPRIPSPIRLPLLPAPKSNLAVKPATLVEIREGGSSEGNANADSTNTGEKKLPEPVPLNEFLNQLEEAEGKTDENNDDAEKDDDVQPQNIEADNKPIEESQTNGTNESDDQVSKS